MEPQFEPLDSQNHVFSLFEPESKLYVSSEKTHTSHDFLDIIAKFLRDSVFGSSFDLWTKTGVSCNLLKIGATGWVALFTR